MPELLDHIFAHIDHAAIRRTFICVCCEWFSINRVRIVCEVLWDSGLPLEVLKHKMRTRVPRATHLYYFFRRSGCQAEEKTDWLLGVLKQTHDEYQQHQRRLVQNPHGDKIFKTRNGILSVKGISAINITQALAA
ncbi:hypothetical protein BGZ47_009847 [Haplosporangium gracile]|nr:hypothetical protein BGZ47_009847 [Haplosporangium gracile]